MGSWGSVSAIRLPHVTAMAVQCCSTSICLAPRGVCAIFSAE